MIEPQTSFTLVTLLILILNSLVGVLSGAYQYSRSDFPADFVFGSGTSAYQVEGAAYEDGRTASIPLPMMVLFLTLFLLIISLTNYHIYHTGYAHGENGDLACDGYHKYKEDVQLMVETGLDAYRFSISWSRLIPNGRGPVNPKGLDYYNNLINELISNVIQPHVTLHNFDIPQALEDEYEGWLSRDVVRDFTDYADVCFREFGDRVLYWITVNEPNVFALGGYDQGNAPPRRCSPPLCTTNNTRGNSTFESYLAVHHILLAHSSAVRLYRTKYRDQQRGFVGISVYTFGITPQTNKEEDVIATQRARDFFVGWIMEPLIYGDYPISMKKNAGARIPTFTSCKSKQVKGSYDFIGVIHYMNINISDNYGALNIKLRDFSADMAVNLIYDQDLFSNTEYSVTPWGLEQELNKFKLLYGNPPIFILENGQRTSTNSSLLDLSRVKYFHGYIGAVLDALRNGSNVKGYFAWSFMDVFELLDGYRASYGLYYVDRNDPELKRYPKLSAKWYKRFLMGRTSSIELVDNEKDPSLVYDLGHLSE